MTMINDLKQRLTNMHLTNIENNFRLQSTDQETNFTNQ